MKNILFMFVAILFVSCSVEKKSESVFVEFNSISTYYNSISLEKLDLETVEYNKRNTGIFFVVRKSQSNDLYKELRSFNGKDVIKVNINYKSFDDGETWTEARIAGLAVE